MKRRQKIEWPKEKREKDKQYNGQRKNDKKDKQYNGQRKNDKRTNNIMAKGKTTKVQTI
jgi:hypothetical protein